MDSLISKFSGGVRPQIPLVAARLRRASPSAYLKLPPLQILGSAPGKMNAYFLKICFVTKAQFAHLEIDGILCCRCGDVMLVL